MKAFSTCALLVLGLAAPAFAGAAAGAASAVSSETPVSRIVKLLEGLALKTKLEGKAEQELYDNFVCWAKSVISQKTASNAEAAARTNTLETYIADIEAGRVEFTSERADLEKELADLNREIEAATALREKEHQEFEDASAEMNKAVTALNSAIAVLKEATADHHEGTFLVQGQQNQGFLARSREAAVLSHAVELGERVLSAGDAVFLRRLLTGDVPEVDWKKLNRDATFKQGYKARSLEIQDVLAKLQGTFTKNLAEATAKEAEAKALFDKLMATQLAQKERTEEAYRKLDAENGAKAEAKAEAQAEVDALKQQVENDTRFIAETQASLAEKKAEWAERSSLRAAEIAAFNKAIEILHNDDARDLMKKSYASQGYSLLQESRHQELAQRRSSTAAVLRRAAGATSDARLAALALRVAVDAGSHFDVVIKAINTLIADLKSEENSDLAKKELCEQTRMTDARTAVKKSREIDDTTDAIASLHAEIKEIEGTIAEKNAAVAHANELLAEATKAREAENEQFLVSKKDDEDAAATVNRAIEVLKNFYADNKLALVQKQPAQVAAGQAPPPPPSTWEAPYGGKTAQAGSVITALENAKEDIEKDAATAKAAEDKAQAAFDKLKADTEGLIEALEASITELEGVKGEKEDTVAESTVSRATKQGELAAVVASIKNAEPGCDFLTVNYEVRVKNRQIEIDGLEKAKTILAGGSFNAGPDPNREVKPGDALFLQKRK